MSQLRHDVRRDVERDIGEHLVRRRGKWKIEDIRLEDGDVLSGEIVAEPSCQLRILLDGDYLVAAIRQRLSQSTFSRANFNDRIVRCDARPFDETRSKLAAPDEIL